MSDDMRLSIDITADLSKLDGALAAAQAKVSAAGQNMQRSLSLGTGSSALPSGGGGFALPPGGGGGGGFAGSGGRFGGGLPMPGGNPVQVAYARVVGPPGGGYGGGGGGGYGLPPAGGFGGQPQGGGGPTWGQAVGSTYAGASGWINRPGNLARVGAAAAFGGAYSEAFEQWNYAYNNNSNPFLYDRFIANAEGKLRGIPLAGGILGSGIDLVRSAGRMASMHSSAGGAAIVAGGGGPLGAVPWAANKIFGQERVKDFFSDPNANANASAMQLDQQRTLNMGFKGGGYYGKMRDLQYQRDVLLPNELEQMRPNTDSTRLTAYEQTKRAAIGLETSEAIFDRSQNIQDIRSRTKQAQLASAGLGGFSQLEEINRSFRQPIALAGQQNDTELGRLLTRQRDAALGATVVQGLRPAQAISANIGNEAIGQGSVQIGSWSGQRAGSFEALVDAIKQWGTSPPTTGRN